MSTILKTLTVSDTHRLPMWGGEVLVNFTGESHPYLFCATQELFTELDHVPPQDFHLFKLPEGLSVQALGVAESWLAKLSAEDRDRFIMADADDPYTGPHSVDDGFYIASIIVHALADPLGS